MHTADDIIRNFFLYLFTRTNDYDPLQHFRQKGDKINACDGAAYNMCNVTQIHVSSNITNTTKNIIVLLTLSLPRFN